MTQLPVVRAQSERIRRTMVTTRRPHPRGPRVMPMRLQSTQRPAALSVALLLAVACLAALGLVLFLPRSMCDETAILAPIATARATKLDFLGLHFRSMTRTPTLALRAPAKTTDAVIP